ncbi:Tn3 family transposase [Streptomyces sp. NPDC056269]|uniref:Tn3 family transposase n=1 Tax=Streptomyces sp. NPDC056269 TaxID=3345768 RepID=UPI0035D7A643
MRSSAAWSAEPRLLRGSAAGDGRTRRRPERSTIYAAKYLSDEGYRRKIARHLNKGESIHALRRQLHYAHDGKITRRQPERQNEQAWSLTVVTNAVICWHTECMGLAVDQLHGAVREVDTEVLAHISPDRSSAVNYYGSITVDYERELASTTRATGRCGPWPPTIRPPG